MPTVSTTGSCTLFAVSNFSYAAAYPGKSRTNGGRARILVPSSSWGSPRIDGRRSFSRPLANSVGSVASVAKTAWPRKSATRCW